MYISNKMEHFSHKGGCGVHGGAHISKHLKEKLAWATDKWLWTISNNDVTGPAKINCVSTKKFKNC